MTALRWRNTMGENLNLDQQRRKGGVGVFSVARLVFYHPHPGKVERVPSSSFFPKDVSNFRQAIILIMYANPT